VPLPNSPHSLTNGKRGADDTTKSGAGTLLVLFITLTTPQCINKRNANTEPHQDPTFAWTRRTDMGRYVVTTFLFYFLTHSPPQVMTMTGPHSPHVATQPVSHNHNTPHLHMAMWTQPALRTATTTTRPHSPRAVTRRRPYGLSIVTRTRLQPPRSDSDDVAI